MSCRTSLIIVGVAVLALSLGTRAGEARAQDATLEDRVAGLEQGRLEDRLGAHIGVATALVTWQQSHKPKSAADRFVIAFPTGVTVRIRPQLAFDFELVPFVVDGEVDLLIHRGLIYNVTGPWSLGLRASFTVDNDTWGFTPLVNRRLFELAEGVSVFAELDLPIVVPESDDVAVSVATHFGIGF